LQTHEPEHPLLTTLLRGGYDAAAALQLGERLASQLPPFAHMALLRAECRQRDVLDGFIAAARDVLVRGVRTQPADTRIRINGPFAAPMPLRAGRHRAQLLLESAQRPPLRHALTTWLPLLHELPQPRGLRWSIDVDPVDLY
jgi:primosomal protein N' (replication factor Y)